MNEHDLEPAPRWLVRLLDAVLLAAVGLTVSAWVFDPLEVFLGPAHLTVSKGAKPILATAALAVFRGLLAWRGRRLAGDVGRALRSPWFLRPVLALASVALFFTLFELVLIAAGFEAELPPIVIRDDSPDEDERTHFLRPDPELRWRLNPGAEFNGRLVNQMGFFDREVDPDKAPGAKRVICMGDSCTAQGIPPYSGFLHERLRRDPPTAHPWESFNMAVHGYSSTQGLRLFQRRTRDLEPDVVTLYYGWNDHWLATKPDSTVMGLSMSAAGAYVFERLRNRRFFQFLIHLLNPVRGIARTDEGMTLRVPPAEYAWNLREFIREIRAVGAVPILITAPRDRQLTPLLIQNRQTKDLEEAMRLHDAYVEITRQVGREEDVRVMDLAEAFSAPAAAPLFADDGIHLTRDGRIRIAGMLHSTLHDLAAAGAFAE